MSDHADLVTLTLFQWMHNMQADITKLKEGFARIGTETDAAVARIVAAHEGELTVLQADIDALADRAQADAERIAKIGVPVAPDAPAPVVVPFAMQIGAGHV